MSTNASIDLTLSLSKGRGRQGRSLKSSILRQAQDEDFTGTSAEDSVFATLLNGTTKP
jgi:hypothetical protein